MSREIWNRAVHQAVEETLENMAFMQVTPVESANLTDPEIRLCWARLEAKEPRRGAMLLQFTYPLAELITQTIFGLEEPPPEQQVFDTLAEILNTMAGRLMSLITPISQTFTLDLPKTGTGFPPEEDREWFVSYFDIEGEFFVFSVEENILREADLSGFAAKTTGATPGPAW